MTVTRRDLARKVAQDMGITLAQADEMILSTLNNITEALANKEVVAIRGFGSFSAKQREPRTGRNPLGEAFETPASVTPRFKPSELLKDLISP